MAGDEIAYNPISYHNGTVWPHDTALVAWGLREHGFETECNLLCHGLFEAAGSLGRFFSLLGECSGLVRYTIDTIHIIRRHHSEISVHY